MVSQVKPEIALRKKEVRVQLRSTPQDVVSRVLEVHGICIMSHACDKLCDAEVLARRTRDTHQFMLSGLSLFFFLTRFLSCLFFFSNSAMYGIGRCIYTHPWVRDRACDRTCTTVYPTLLGRCCQGRLHDNQEGTDTGRLVSAKLSARCFQRRAFEHRRY